ncbi:MAG: UDP-glucose--dolichyl-phosphate glucosyltransferase [Myxococcales bacterium]|nr:UDP-glucose--dolichyl-phosphate glucosyltransferase [Myxococcales bacterium]
MKIDALIPALNEETNIGYVLDGLKARGIRRIVVADNGSTDGTAAVATKHGAIVVTEARKGYGAACLAGLNYLRTEAPDILVFLDGDGADDPNDFDALVKPVVDDQADLVIGSRTRGDVEPGALTPVQHFGNRLSCVLIQVLFGVKFSDLGPFRAIRWSALERLDMADRDFGWTVEMQAKAAKRGLRCLEIPVRCKRRFSGKSKVSGTLNGSVRAGVKILYTIGREALIRS